MQRCLMANGTTLLNRVQSANTFWLRLKGLLGRTGLDPEEGLLIEPCNSVHTLGMKFAIAVVFLAADNRVLHLIPDMPPGKLSPVVRGARKVLELHPQCLLNQRLGIGEILKFESQHS